MITESQQLVFEYANKYSEYLEMWPSVCQQLLLDSMARKIIKLEGEIEFYKKRSKVC